MGRKHIRTTRSVKFLTDFNDQSEDALVIPEDLGELSTEDLTDLRTQATEAFNAIYQGGEGDFSEEDLETMQALTDGVEALNAEIQVREAATAERREAAAALAATVTPAEEETLSAEDDEGEDEEESDEDEEETEEVEEDAEEGALTAGSGRREVRVNLANLRGRTPAPRREASEGPSIRDVAFASSEAGGGAVGASMDFLDMGRSVDHRLRSFNASQYAKAASAGRRMRQQFGVASIQKQYGDLMINTDSPSQIEEILSRAVDQSALPGGSLVASGGWCAPSETIYDIYDCGEVADGLLSIPTVGVNRGGIRFNRGISFNDLLTQTGFHYTEDQDIAGEYGVDENGVGNDTEGSKPCFKIECVEWDEERLELDGLCLQAGLLQAKGYPEVIADTIRKALIAHEIRMDSRRIAKIAAGSTAVTLPADQVGATAPILTAIELQAQHYRSAGSLGDNTVLEGIFPQWVRGVIRSDLSRRLGVDMISVPNSRINAWFTERQINPQFVRNYQPISGTAAGDFTAWPTSLSFLLYKAGTWLGANSDVLTLDTMYDSTLLGENDYTALFTEEGTMTFMRGCDSREVTLNICPDGATHGGVDIDCDGTAVVGG